MVTVPSAWPACHAYSVNFKKQLSEGMRPGYYGGTTLTILGLFTGEVNPGTAVMELVLRINRPDGTQKSYSRHHQFSYRDESLFMEWMIG